MWNILKNLKLSITLLFISSICFVLVWCGSNWDGESKYITNVAWYSLMYNWDVDLWKVALKNDDLNEIIDLYQELWDDVQYRDSLLIAEKFNQWLWINAFAQDNLDTLKKQWLALSDIRKIQITLKKKSENINAVLVNYKITEWFIDEVPLVYVSQLFIPNGYNVELISYITEDPSSHTSAVNMLKNVN